MRSDVDVESVAVRERWGQHVDALVLGVHLDDGVVGDGHVAAHALVVVESVGGCTGITFRGVSDTVDTLVVRAGQPVLRGLAATLAEADCRCRVGRGEALERVELPHHHVGRDSQVAGEARAVDQLVVGLAGLADEVVGRAVRAAGVMAVGVLLALESQDGADVGELGEGLVDADQLWRVSWLAWLKESHLVFVWDVVLLAKDTSVADEEGIC